jgi:signal recognition particle subunit SRP54
MGGEAADLVVPSPGTGPRVILMAGLQGVGKTTACGKLAKHLLGRGQSVMMVATDVYRPAAIDQLVSLGKRVNVPVFEMGTGVKPAEIAAKGLEKAKAEGVDAVIVDTAGRLQIDESMMAELADVAAAVTPTDTLLVVDAMTGQEAAALAAAFGAAAPLTGVVLTKMDGDARGGAALSVRAVSGKPIKFVGTGEKLDALEQFYPDRLAGRILGMGDVLSLVEKAEAAIAEEDAAAMTKRMLSAKFDFNDFLKQYEAVTGMGGMGALMKMLPGMAAITDKQLAAAEAQFKVYKSMIDSMTPGERADPDLLARVPSRRRRVARGAGRTEADVAGLLATFAGMRSRMRSLSSMLTGGPGGAPPGMLSNEELMEATVSTAAAGVPAGKVRRRRPKRAVVSRGGGGGFGAKAAAKVGVAKAVAA